MVRIFIVLILFLSTFMQGLGQEKGSPFSRNYPAKEYKAHTQNWAIVQDKRGVMYFGNNHGVLEYDGVNWTLIPAKRDVFSLAIDTTGRIYVGVVGEIGYLEPDARGKIGYVSLLNKLNGGDRSFEHVWKTHAASHGVYFQSFQSLIRWKNGQMRVWYPSHDTINDAPRSFHFSFLVNDRLYIREDGIGLLEMKGDSLQLVPGGELFAAEKIYAMMPYDKGRILVGTLSKGFFLYETTSGRFVPFATEADRFLFDNQIYHGIRLVTGDFAIATTSGGVVIIDKEGIIVQFVNRQAHLQNEGVHYLYNDRQNNLWMALDNGISTAEMASPWQQWNESHGLKGSVYSITRHDGILYIGTSQGAFYMENNHFYPVENLRGPTWNWLEIPAAAGRKSKLLAANASGIYEVRGHRAQLLFRGTMAFVLFHSIHLPDRIYSGFDNGLVALRLEGDNLIYEGKLPEIQGEIRNIVEDDDGNIVLNNLYQGIIIVKPNEGRGFKALEIIRLNAFSSLDLHQHKLYTLNNELLLAKDQKMYRFNKARGDFEQDALMSQVLKQGAINLMTADSLGNIWLSISPYKGNREMIEVLHKQPGGGYKHEATSFRRLPEMVVQSVFPEPNGATWIGGSEGLFRYDTRVPYNYKQKYQALIRKVNLGEDSVLFQGTYFKDWLPGDKSSGRVTSLEQAGLQQPQLEYGDNTITFQYAVPYFKDEASNLYSYYLEDFDKTWSAWSTETKKQYTFLNLPEGEYTFHVKARNIYGIESMPASYVFRVLPPWYRSRWAYLAYAALSVAFIWGIVRFNTTRLVEEKLRLEQMVKERTAEITMKNAELEQQKEEILEKNEVIMAKNQTLEMQKGEIEKKNQDITASINYAQRIQSVMLPQVEKIKRALPDSFILFRPRDIVSGDFYWFSKFGNKTIITCVDCTGHGVPGAFMSMIGNNLLNEIVNVRKITAPEEVLKELHLGVNAVLKQDETKNRDGMDMAFCVIDEKEKVLHFAGAKNPLIYIQNGEVVEIKGDKQPIGGSWNDETLESFTRHEIPLSGPISFYITSDGYEDQFGGPKGKKFMKKRLKELFLEIHHLPMAEQEKVLHETMLEWMHGHSQVDDILVIGFRMSE